jgi:rhodanese-related sulfurtransferase
MRISKTTIILSLLAIPLFLPSLGYSADLPSSVEQLVTNTKKVVKTINMADFKALYDKKDYGLLVDVRDPDEYASGHIPGSVNISRGTLEFKIWKHVGGAEKPDLSKKLLIYCATGGRCALAVKSLMDLKFANVTAVDMRLADWKKAGYPFVENQ